MDHLPAEMVLNVMKLLDPVTLYQLMCTTSRLYSIGIGDFIASFGLVEETHSQVLLSYKGKSWTYLLGRSQSYTITYCGKDERLFIASLGRYIPKYEQYNFIMVLVIEYRRKMFMFNIRFRLEGPHNRFSIREVIQGCS